MHINPENIKLNKNYIWDTLEIDWKEFNVTFNDNKINLPRVVIIKLQDKMKIICLMKKEPHFFHLMLNKELHDSLQLQAHRRLLINITKTLNDNVANFPDGLFSQT